MTFNTLFGTSVEADYGDEQIKPDIRSGRLIVASTVTLSDSEGSDAYGVAPTSQRVESTVTLSDSEGSDAPTCVQDILSICIIAPTADLSAICACSDVPSILLNYIKVLPRTDDATGV